MTPAQARHVLGAQGQLWTTYMPTPYHLEYMAFPQLAALAEAVWSPVAKKDYESLKPVCSRSNNAGASWG